MNPSVIVDDKVAPGKMLVYQLETVPGVLNFKYIQAGEKFKTFPGVRWMRVLALNGQVVVKRTSSCGENEYCVLNGPSGPRVTPMSTKSATQVAAMPAPPSSWEPCMQLENIL